MNTSDKKTETVSLEDLYDPEKAILDLFSETVEDDYNREVEKKKMKLPEKVKSQAEKISDVQRSLREDAEYQAALDEVENNYTNKYLVERDKLNESVSDYFKRSYQNRNKKIEQASKRDSILDEAANKVLSYVFANIVYESLPIKNDIKSNPETLDKIYQEAVDVYNHNVVTITQSPYFKQLYGNALIYLDKTSLDGTLGDKVCAQIASNLATGDVLRPYVIKSMKSVVNEAIVDESNIAHLAETHREQKKYVEESHTLFRNLYLNAINEAVADNVSMKRDDLEKYASMDASVQLTILETLNFCRLVEVDHNKFKLNMKNVNMKLK